MSGSRISGLHRLDVAERIDALRRAGRLSDADAELLRQGRHVLAQDAADKIIENVVGTFGLPFAIAPNFVINGTEYLVPMVVEEPSVVAGSSFAALLARKTGGFKTERVESLLAGQVHVTGVRDAAKAIEALEAARADLLEQADAVHPRLKNRGGGVREIDLRPILLEDGSAAIAVHLLVDTSDAMGANLVNTICEAVAPRIAELSGGDVALRILSNLADRSLVTARVDFACDQLAAGDMPGESVRDRIVLASHIADADPYRATTHNKGVMNGVDAVALATGNDWRAIEAGAHAHAAATGRYRPLSTWRVARNGNLEGELTLPVKVGIVGGTVEGNPAAALALRVLGVESAGDLADVMAAVGLAQNFAALRALATSGIQAGHMKLHARSVARAAGVPDDRFDEVVRELVAGGEIKQWRAEEILAGRKETPAAGIAATAAGKVILLGEHAAVYGKHALAVPVPDAVRATVSANDAETRIIIPEWRVDTAVVGDDPSGIGPAVLKVLSGLGIEDSGFDILVNTKLPRGMGLGSSAALAVAVTRAFAEALDLGVDDEAVNAVAFECEKLAHGTPSGIDNTLATFGKPMLFRRDGELELQVLDLAESPPLVVAFAQRRGVTREQVAGVRERREHAAGHYDAIFDEIDALSRAGAEALVAGDYDRLGRLMNICHGLLCAIEVSTPELDAMVALARSAGAAGAKLTGGGGGGSIVALCPGKVADVTEALGRAGFRVLD